MVYDISFIRHFVALTPSWHSSQARRALNPCVPQNASYETRIIIYYYSRLRNGELQTVRISQELDSNFSKFRQNFSTIFFRV
jgi:hypothetical protein